MQENELHGWRVSDSADMRMSGYPTKVKSMSWLPKGRYVVAAGYEDGATILVQIDRADSALVKRPGEGAVTALAWSADGQHLALGTESGFVGRISLSDWRTPS